MRAPLLTVLLLASPAADQGVTVHFRNATGKPVYVDTTFGDGVVFGKGKDTFARFTWVPPCGRDCHCLSVVPPLPSVRVLAAGESLDVSWNGAWFDTHACNAPAGNCRCSKAATVAPGRYTARFEGALGVEQAAPRREEMGARIEGVRPDARQGACRAAVEVVFDGKPHAVETTILCDLPAN